jgi:lycopene beta-cyclase
MSGANACHVLAYTIPVPVSSPSRPLDALVIGKGPAALAVAAALIERGMRVGVLGPPGPIKWPAQYGAWANELTAAGYPEMVAQQWSETLVSLGAGSSKTLPYPYVRVDKERLAHALAERCETGGVQWLDGQAASVKHDAAISIVRCEDGSEVSARLVIDASGHRPALVSLPAAPPQGFQTAVGWTFEADHHPFAADRATLMDWERPSFPAAKQAASAPSFLYAMPLDNGLIFAEETVLVARPAVPFEVLEQRLRERLRSLGVHPSRIVERELCWIPMGGALPHPSRVVGFGGAARMVHPATGYLLTSVLETAPRLVDAVVQMMGASGAHPAHVSSAAWNAVWPADRRLRRELFRFGMEVLLRLDTAATQAFFGAFFRLPDAEWQGYLNDRLPSPQLAAVMGRLFLQVPPSVRDTMMRSMVGTNGVRLGAALLRRGVA